ncbi:MAG: hypothetical protein QN187_04880 [Armatimonadota bacterium]|nr:hypothetical protein [Armatimonadota bacterium]MDR7519110.1 hypothetical protein [Armatimonadota bacterium]MDR7548961.1 hypothetical protein [Armatimonadota bacterium]
MRRHLRAGIMLVGVLTGLGLVALAAYIAYLSKLWNEAAKF